jgi:hypothetical protein
MSGRCPARRRERARSRPTRRRRPRKVALRRSRLHRAEHAYSSPPRLLAGPVLPEDIPRRRHVTARPDAARLRGARHGQGGVRYGVGAERRRGRHKGATAGGAAPIVPAEMSCCRPVPIDCDERRRKIDVAGTESKFEDREFSV